MLFHVPETKKHQEGYKEHTHARARTRTHARTCTHTHAHAHTFSAAEVSILIGEMQIVSNFSFTGICLKVTLHNPGLTWNRF